MYDFNQLSVALLQYYLKKKMDQKHRQNSLFVFENVMPLDYITKKISDIRYLHSKAL